MDILQEIQNTSTEFQSRLSTSEPEVLAQEYLGRKGKVAQLFKHLPMVDPEQKGNVGQALNQLKQEIEESLNQQNHKSVASNTSQDLPNIIPPSLDQLSQEVGHLSPVTATMFRLQDILGSLGFSVVTGPEIETEYYNFDALNIPDEHPARDVWDTVWVSSTDSQKSLLRTHTSPVQIRHMEKTKPPIRIVAPGRVYRYESTDATHETTFHQIEGLMVDTTTSIATFKGVIKEIFSKLFDQEIEIRLRPSHFPFTEPSFEIDVKFNNRWLEIAGAGMVHRSVLAAGNITDPAVQGFAFGMGIERIVMLLTGLDDIRYIHSGDLRFVYQLGIQKN